MEFFDVNNATIFKTVAGSRLYGTFTTTSDTDYRGVCIPPDRIHLSPFMNFEQLESVHDDDLVIYGLRKFFNLAYDNNPNILELLFVNKNTASLWSVEWDTIHKNRKQFLSRKIGQTFAGYALSQLHKIKQHREWFLNPPDHRPTRGEFGLTDSPFIPSVHRDAMLKMPIEFFNANAQTELQKERQYNDAMTRWVKYEQWLLGRNASRRELESAFKYDTKHGMHLLRLIYQAIELVTTKDLIFPLQDAKYLKQVRDGSLEYDALIQEAEDGLKVVDQMIESCDLPKSPDVNQLNDLYFHVKSLHDKRV